MTSLRSADDESPLVWLSETMGEDSRMATILRAADAVMEAVSIWDRTESGSQAEDNAASKVMDMLEAYESVAAQWRKP